MPKPGLSHRRCLSVDEAKTLQARLAGLVERSDQLSTTIGRVAGVDVAYEARGNRLYAAVVTLDFETLSILETATHEDSACFPYISGLFSFREIPPLIRALTKLTHAPDLLICDGQGLAHPRRFGLACHLGLLLNIPTIGCAKSCLIGDYHSPEDQRGDYSLLTHKGETIGAVLRTQDRTKTGFCINRSPSFPGHRLRHDIAADPFLPAVGTDTASQSARELYKARQKMKLDA